MIWDNIRRGFGFLVTIVVVFIAGWQAAEHPHARDSVLRWPALGAIILMVIALAVLEWAALTHSHWKTWLAFAIGIAASWWIHDEFHPKFLWFALVLLVFIVLYAITVPCDRLWRRIWHVLVG